jgi:hypothetical protein
MAHELLFRAIKRILVSRRLVLREPKSFAKSPLEGSWQASFEVMTFASRMAIPGINLD